jgi:hypothetical protein
MERMRELSQMFSRQTFLDYGLVVINNDFSRKDEVESAFLETGTSVPVRFVHNEFNMGILSRYLETRKSGCEYAVFLDDDLSFRKDMMSVFCSEKKRRSVSSVLAYVFDREHKCKKRVKTDPTVIGSGCCVLDADIIRTQGFWNGWKPEFFVCDDYWLSYYAKRQGYELRLSGAPVFLNLPDKSSMLKNKTVQKIKEDFAFDYGWLG